MTAKETEGFEQGCQSSHREITLYGEHIVCLECGTHEGTLQIGGADLARLLGFVETIYSTLTQVGLADTANQLRQRAGELVVNKRLTWRV